MDHRRGFAERRPPPVHGAGGATDRVHGLAGIGEIGLEEMAERLARRREVDVHDAITVLDQLGDDSATRLAAAAGDDDALHGRSLSLLPSARIQSSSSMRKAATKPSGWSSMT